MIWLAWELVNFVENFVPDEFKNWTIALSVAVPGLSAQATLFSNDILMTAALFGVLKSLEKNRPWYLALCIFIAGTSSLRGIMVLPAIVAFAWIYYPEKRRDYLFVLQSGVGGMLVFGWLIWHWMQTGWFTHPPSVNWSTQHELADLDGWIHNFLTIGFRFVDQGRIVVWVILFWVWFTGRWRFNPELNKLSGLFLLSTLCLSMIFIPFNNPPGHRYFLFEFVVLSIFSTLVILTAWPYSRWLRIVILLSFISGHFWIYPENISKGWDSSLAHLSWSEYRQEALEYLRENRIPPSYVGTAYPLLHPGRYTHLNEEVWSFSEMDLSKNPYILYSNLCNGVSSETLKVLKREWDVEASWGSWPVYYTLFRNPEQFPVEPLPTKEMAIIGP